MKVKIYTAAMLVGLACLATGKKMFAVEPLRAVPAVSPLMVDFDRDMTSQTLTILIEQHAAPHWNLTVAYAWDLYNGGVLKVTEIIPEQKYVLEYGGGEIIVHLDGGI